MLYERLAKIPIDFSRIFLMKDIDHGLASVGAQSLGGRHGSACDCATLSLQTLGMVLPEILDYLFPHFSESMRCAGPTRKVPMLKIVSVV